MWTFNSPIHGSIYLKGEDVVAENDEVLDEVVDQGGVQHQVAARGDGTQRGPETDGEVVTVHLGVITGNKQR